MARSMVSTGTDASRALPIIERSVALESGSPPPSRAATSTWRISLAKSLPRALSLAPVWCLIVAHLQWPDMALQTSEEQLMDARVARQLRVERGDQHRTLTAQHGVVADRGEDLDAVAHLLDVRRADE